MSFETAAKRMSADVLSFGAGSSSVKKGESLRDTIETIQAIGMDAVIIRHSSSGVPARVAEWVDHCAVVNAGDGWHQHPTQALLDLYTVRQSLGGGDEGTDRFDGLRVTIVGRHPPQPGGPVPDHRLRRARGRGHPGGTGHAAAALARGVADRRGAPRPRRRAGRHRRHLAAAAPGRAGERGLRPDHARVHGRLRPHRPTGPPAPARRHHPAPRAHGPRASRSPPRWPSCPSARITDQVGNGVAVRMAVLFLLLGQGAREAELHD